MDVTRDVAVGLQKGIRAADCYSFLCFRYAVMESGMGGKHWVVFIDLPLGYIFQMSFCRMGDV